MLPNLYIIGGIKCGTTSLHAYLAEHPQVFMSAPKELHVFQKENWRERLGRYERQFPAGAAVRGESTPHYTLHPYRPHVPDRISSVVPEARFIYLVRDPIKRIVSHWVQRYSMGERGRSLDDYVRDCHDPYNQVVCASRYYSQIEQYLRVFPRERLLVIDQHELKTDRERTLREVFRFVGVDDGFASPVFATERNTRADKRALTQVGMPLWNRVLGPAVRRLPEPARTGARRRLVRALSRPITESPQLTAGQRDRLRSALQDEVDQLRQLTGKKFASWSL